MDSIIKSSIDARKNAIVNAYELNDKQQKEVDGLFSEIEKLGKESKDAGDFETKFQASPLNQKYMDLFTKIATDNASNAAAKDMAKGVVAGAAESALRSAVGSTVPTTRAAVHQKAYDAARDIPGVGEVLSVKQHVDFFSRFKKPKK